MATRPSEPLLELLRKVSRERGMNTASLARSASLDRTHLKHVLAGSEPLTVDELIALSQVLQLGPAELGQVSSAAADVAEAAVASDEASDEAVGEGDVGEGDVDYDGDEDEDNDEDNDIGVASPRSAALRMADEIGGLDPITEAADPYGNHAAQAMHLGLALGCDLHLVLDSAKIQESGVPRSVLAQFPERLPVRLDAAFHRHHDLRFLPEAVQMTLSFDALYTCVFPWDAIQQVTIFPLPPELDEPEEEPEEEPEPTSRRGHLRLLD